MSWTNKNLYGVGVSSTDHATRIPGEQNEIVTSQASLDPDIQHEINWWSGNFHDRASLSEKVWTPATSIGAASVSRSELEILITIPYSSIVILTAPTKCSGQMRRFIFNVSQVSE